MSTAFKGEISDMNAPLDDIQKILNFQKSQGIKSTLPDSIIRFKQICLNCGLDTQTTNDLTLSKFHQFLNVKSIKEI